MLTDARQTDKFNTGNLAEKTAEGSTAQGGKGLASHNKHR